MLKAATRRISASMRVSARTQAVAPPVHSAREIYPPTGEESSKCRTKIIRPPSQHTRPQIIMAWGSCLPLARRKTASESRHTP